MAEEVVIDFSQSGDIQALHNDRFSLGFLGKMSFHRASSIEFDEDRQSFFICPLGMDIKQAKAFTPLVGFVGYDVARRFEVLYFNECRKLGIKPVYGAEAADLAFRLRESFKNEV